MTVGEILLDEAPVSVEVGRRRLCFRSTKRPHSYDLVITLSGQRLVLPNFPSEGPSDVNRLPKGSPLRPCVIHAFDGRAARHLVLVGDTEIGVLDLKPLMLIDSVRLHREPVRDRSWDRLEVTGGARRWLIFYERGALALSLTGRVLWHVELYWDDLLLRRDRHQAWYCSPGARAQPAGTASFVIDLATGERHTLLPS
jgi:hypothetical protein